MLTHQKYMVNLLLAYNLVNTIRTMYSSSSIDSNIILQYNHNNQEIYYLLPNILVKGFLFIKGGIL